VLFEGSIWIRLAAIPQPTSLADILTSESTAKPNVLDVGQMPYQAKQRQLGGLNGRLLDLPGREVAALPLQRHAASRTALDLDTARLPATRCRTGRECRTRL